MIFDHVGIVVPTIGAGVTTVGQTLPIDAWTQTFDDAGLRVSVKFARDSSGAVFELIAPFGDKSPVDAILKKRDGILNQLAYRVADLSVEAKAMRDAGAVPLGKPMPAIAFGGAPVQFFMTKANFVVELIEAPSFSHAFE